MRLKTNKYGNRKVALDGFVFDSQREATRYLELKMLERQKEIFGLRLQVPFEIVVNNKKICRYVSDFVYRERDKSADTIEDVKSEATRKNRAYRIKKKLVEASYGVTIKET